jgi:glycosyltransferase involved in cell wall biosynthesis
MRVLMHLRPDWQELPGGDLVQLQRWAVWLLELGVDVEVTCSPTPELRGVDLVHFHNLGRASVLWGALQHCRTFGVPTVLTPLYWPADEFDRLGRPGWSGRLSRLLPDGLRRRLKAALRKARQDRGRFHIAREFWTNGPKRLQRFLTAFDALAVNSLAEVDALTRLSSALPPMHIVHSGVDAFFWSEDRTLWALEGDQLLPDGTRQRTLALEQPGGSPEMRPRTGVLCVARFDPQKAQHRLIEALRPLGVSLTLAGADNPNYPDYRAYCQRLADSQVTLLPRVSKSQLKLLYRTCRVHALTSWYETTGLTALEAGCCGARSVVTSRGGTRDYGGELAWYVDPSNLSSVRATIERALAAPETPDFLGRVRSRFTWHQSTQRLLRVYAAVLEGRPFAFTWPECPSASPAAAA